MRLLPFIALGLVTTLSACGHHDKNPPPPVQQSGDLNRTFDMVDPKDGHRYGTVEMSPVGGGRVRDADGRLIGDIVPPER